MKNRQYILECEYAVIPIALTHMYSNFFIQTCIHTIQDTLGLQNAMLLFVQDHITCHHHTSPDDYVNSLES